MYKSMLFLYSLFFYFYSVHSKVYTIHTLSTTTPIFIGGSSRYADMLYILHSLMRPAQQEAD